MYSFCMNSCRACSVRCSRRHTDVYLRVLACGDALLNIFNSARSDSTCSAHREQRVTSSLATASITARCTATASHLVVQLALLVKQLQRLSQLSAQRHLRHVRAQVHRVAGVAGVQHWSDIRHTAVHDAVLDGGGRRRHLWGI
jgi:hypothetical protein